MKKVIFVFLFLLFSLQANALEIVLPDTIAANTNFSALIEFENASSLNEAIVFLDDSKIIELGIPIKIDEKIVLNYFIEENKLYLSLAGLREGTHTIKVAGKEEAVKEFSVVKILSEEDKTELEKKISDLQKFVTEKTLDVREVELKLNDLEEAIKGYASKQEIEQKLSELSKSIESIQLQLGEILRDLNYSAASMLESIAELRAKVQSQQSELNALQSLTSTGFISFHSIKQENVLVALVVIALALFLFFLVKNKSFREKIKLPKKSIKEPLESKEEEKIAGEVLEETQFKGKGKWAFKEKEEEKEE